MFKLCAFAVALLATGLHAQPKPDFTGLWKQNDERCVPKRTNNPFVITNKVEQRDPDLTVWTTLKGQGSESTRERKYKTDGSDQVTNDKEGDEIHNRVHWEGASLVFDMVEKEKRRTITSNETWTLIDDGRTLKKVLRGTAAKGDYEVVFIFEKQDEAGK